MDDPAPSGKAASDFAPFGYARGRQARKASSSRRWRTANSGDPYPDPAEPSGTRVAIDIVPVRRLPHPVPLAVIKATRALAALPLVRLPRLSVMPVGDREWAEIEKLSAKAPRANA